MSPATDPFASAELSAWLDNILVQAREARQRRLLIVAGRPSWCRRVAQQILAAAKLPRACWISSQQQVAAEVVAAAAATQLLGQEREAIVFDAHSGFDPDAFAAVSGVICGGGLMLLLCPPLNQWPSFADPAAQRIAVWPHEFADLGGRFLRRMARIISTAPSGVALLQQDAALPLLRPADKPLQAHEFNDPLFRTEDQRAAVAAIEHVLHGHRRRPLVLVADRGRGKTAALGIAAARLLQQTAGLRIVVTAPRAAAVQPLFAQVHRLLADAHLAGNRLQWQEGVIEFVAPDNLCMLPVSAHLVLVDEAAAIPATLLQRLLAHYSRLVFSTTTHGYEGTGRGFAVRFKQTLDAHTPGWKELTLHTPIRWAAQDPLEALVFKALLLDAAAADDAVVSGATVDEVVLEKIDRDKLADDEALLSQLFGLLVVAHYRTRPNDLRNLLDGPGLSVYVSRYRGQVVATALVASEGGFDATITQAIYTGRRRPRGHLIPQSLVTHVGLKEAGGLRCARIMRMAVHPALQGQGLGRQLLQRITREAQSQGMDLLGVSFGATRALVRFWFCGHLQPVRVGFRRDHASGEYSVMMLRGLSPAGGAVYEAARARYLNDLPHWLGDPLQTLEVSLVADLLPAADQEAKLPAGHDQAMLQSFVRGERSYEDALGAIWRLLQRVQAQSPAVLQNEDGYVLLAKVLQRQTWATVAKGFALAGRAGVLAELRRGVALCLDAVSFR